jgi:hypothetical protein
MTRRLAAQVGVGNGVRPASKLARETTEAPFPGTQTRTALILPDGLGFECWESVGQTLLTLGRSVAWWVGDWYLFGEQRYGERAAQAVGDETGYAAHTVQNAAWVASRFEPSRRREHVTFGTHAALAGLEDAGQRYALLERADTERWTCQRTREEVKRLKQISGPPGVDEERSVDVGELMLTLYEEKGILIVQRRDRRTGVALDRSTFTDEALELVQDFVDGNAR